jgi:hypothetical protein
LSTTAYNQSENERENLLVVRQNAKPDMGRRRRQFLFARARQSVSSETRDGPPDGDQQDFHPDAPARKSQADYLGQSAARFGGLAPRFP